MLRTFTTFVLFMSLLLLADSAFSTKMKSTWKEPLATAASLQFKKVLVIVDIKQPLTRKVAEDKAVKIIESGGATHAVPSYTIIDEEQLNDKDAAKSKIADMGFDGVVVMRSAGSKDERKYDAEADNDWDYYNEFWGAYGAGWGGVYNATTTNDLYVLIETMFYSLKDGKLIWAGITETRNPKNPAKVVAEIAEETTKYLQKQGLLVKKK